MYNRSPNYDLLLYIGTSCTIRTPLGCQNNRPQSFKVYYYYYCLWVAAFFFFLNNHNNLIGLCSGKLSPIFSSCSLWQDVLHLHLYWQAGCIKFINDMGLGCTAAHINNNFLSEVVTLLLMVEDRNNRFSATVTFFVWCPPS